MFSFLVMIIQYKLSDFNDILVGAYSKETFSQASVIYFGKDPRMTRNGKCLLSCGQLLCTMSLMINIKIIMTGQYLVQVCFLFNCYLTPFMFN